MLTTFFRQFFLICWKLPANGLPNPTRIKTSSNRLQSSKKGSSTAVTGRSEIEKHVFSNLQGLGFSLSSTQLFSLNMFIVV